ncbi:hypothetical protein [Pararhizobium antarcticum]|uniref:Uncharacterized protein n=1 Tax=Pararhizobium antarcticum TaxID=1798805 RepID=A0A657LRK8_9HYPH|nr:hypothetical protein [Pararhizobium antarcticum]OJF95034.1 hypothetical protein AX760_04195 [Pararhizobium antarcticum]OJF98145.1 hypothetical protein AX761_13095 [Rhizobium sp. 58]
MLTFADEGNGSGMLEINGHSRPVSYELVVAREEDDTKQVRIRLKAPRDWLLEQGFNGEAILVRDNGARIPVRREGGLSVEDNVAVTLEGYDETEAGVAATEEYPELKN